MDHNPAQEINPHIPAAARWIGATPLVVFLAVYLLTSLILRDFYAMPITVAFLVSSVYAVAITRGLSTEKRVLRFSRGVADYNLLMMIWIFVLAGAFSEAAKSIGAIDATVHLILRLLPAGLLLPGLFLASCVISLSIGTSVGTVVALRAARPARGVHRGRRHRRRLLRRQPLVHLRHHHRRHTHSGL